MPNIVAKIIPPAAIAPGAYRPFPLERYSKSCLAQGDSWFSIGAVPPWATSNLLDQMVFRDSLVIVNCATPGEELAHMTDKTTQRSFLKLLRGNLSYKWDCVFLSGGGNDLIDALQAPPSNAPKERLLRRHWNPSESGVGKYISEEGWGSFVSHMAEVVDNFLAERDKGQNAYIPVFLHTYDYPTPRNSPVFPGKGPWLYKALNDLYAIPKNDWIELTDCLFLRMAAMWKDIAQTRPNANLNVINSAGTISRAQLDSPGISGDWENEIHPTAHGYSQLADIWRPQVESILWPQT